jgi:hypothetical protein
VHVQNVVSVAGRAPVGGGRASARGAPLLRSSKKPYGFTDFTRQCTEKIKKGAGMSMWLQESLSDNC